MAVSFKIKPSNFSNEESLRMDFNYVNYYKKTKFNSTLSGYIESKKNDLLDNLPDEFYYVEIGNLNSKGKIYPSYINLNLRNYDNEDLIKKIENGDIQSVEVNDILISSVRPGLKKILLIDSKTENLYFTKAFHKIRSKINPKICFYLLKNVYFNTLNSYSRMGKGYPTLNINDLLYAKIDSTNFENFQKNEKIIIESLEKIEKQIEYIEKDLINENNVINETFEKTYNYSFKKIYNQNYLKNFKIKFSDLINSSDFRLGFKFRNPLRKELTNLISNFSDHKINHYTDIPIQLGQTLSEDKLDITSEKYYITMAEIKTQYLDIDDAPKISLEFYDENKDSNSTKLNDILFARSGEGTIGKVAIVDQNIEGLFADFLMRIRLKDYPANYAYYFFRTDLFQELVNLTKKGLGNNTNIYPSDISELPLPNLNNKLIKCCEIICEKIKINYSKIKLINELKNDLNKLIYKYVNQ